MTEGRFSRRRFMTSAGVGITLPMLPSLLYSRRAQAAVCAPPKRFIVYHFANGHHMREHVPTGAGAGAAWKLPPMLVSMQDLKSDLTFVSGLENQARRKETGDHALGCGALLTARKPTKNMQITNMSVDQVIADALSAAAPPECRGIPSLQLGTHNVGPTDQFGTFYSRSISWRGQSVANPDGTMSFPTGNATPLGKEIDPQKAFDRLFRGSDPAVSAGEAEMRRALRKSVLDTVVPHGDRLKNSLNAADRTKLDQLFTGIRSLEKDLQATPTAMPAGTCVKPSAPLANMDFPKQLDYMHTLMALACQCDVTRVITFMMSDALSNRNLSFIPEVAALGGDAGDHAVSHHSGNPEFMAKFRVMVLWKMARIAEFIRKLKSLQDVDGQPVLDNTLVWISSEIADGQKHNHDNKPILLAGRLGGLVTPDRHVAYPVSSDYTKVKTFGDFFITLMGLFGVRATEFGNDGKEAIAWNR